VKKILIVAKYSNVVIVVPPFNMDETKSDEFLAINPFGKVPLLRTPEGAIFETNAIIRHIGRLSHPYPIYGSNIYEASKIDSWIDWSRNEIEYPTAILTYPIWNFMDPDTETIPNALEETRNLLLSLNKHLLVNTFLVTNKITLADISVAFALLPLFMEVFDPSFRRQVSNVFRWFETVVNQKIFLNIFGEVTYCSKSPYTNELKPQKQSTKKSEKKKLLKSHKTIQNKIFQKNLLLKKKPQMFSISKTFLLQPLIWNNGKVCMQIHILQDQRQLLGFGKTMIRKDIPCGFLDIIFLRSVQFSL